MLPDKYKKQSFLKFFIEVETKKLIDEFKAIPDSEWSSSYWGNVHCAVGTLLLRGGNKGTQADYAAKEVYDHKLLTQCPYIESLIGPEGLISTQFN